MNEEHATTMGRVGARVGMTEGQVYSAVFVVLVVLLLSLTGLPTAERRTATGASDVPTLQPLVSEEAP